MTVFSPAAISVISAGHALDWVNTNQLAAAIRAAVDHAIPADQSTDRGAALISCGDILWDDDTAACCRRRLLAIADELEQPA